MKNDKIIIISNQPKNKIESLVLKVSNGKIIPEIIFLHPKNFKNKEFLDDQIFIIYDSDEIDSKSIVKDLINRKIDFGFNENATLRASDVIITNDEINFKLNFKGNSVPVWSKNENHTNNADEVYNILSAICVGDFLGLNIVEISENLKG
jgi:UDP-N-acetylmuramyl pentapeptide synthase